MSHPLIKEVLTFWFRDPKSKDFGKPQPMWFNSTPEIDQSIRSRFEEIYEKAKKGDLNNIKDTPEGAMALILILDQFPRNMFRSTAQAYETDPMARDISKFAIRSGFDQKLPPFMRAFMYLPLEHSENREDQNFSVSLYEKLGDPLSLDYAQQHKTVIERFGRFPYRNESLGRISTDEEHEFMRGPRKF